MKSSKGDFYPVCRKKVTNLIKWPVWASAPVAEYSIEREKLEDVVYFNSLCEQLQVLTTIATALGGRLQLSGYSVATSVNSAAFTEYSGVIIEHSGAISEHSTAIPEDSDAVIEDSGAIIEHSDAFPEHSETILEYSDAVSERSGATTERSETIIEDPCLSTKPFKMADFVIIHPLEVRNRAKR